jgi:hypothetical protein
MLMMLSYLEKVGNDVDGLAGDLLPEVGRVHEVRVLYLLVDVLVLVKGESS